LRGMVIVLLVGSGEQAAVARAPVGVVPSAAIPAAGSRLRRAPDPLALGLHRGAQPEAALSVLPGALELVVGADPVPLAGGVAAERVAQVTRQRAQLVRGHLDVPRLAGHGEGRVRPFAAKPGGEPAGAAVEGVDVDG